jgi:glycosyltransferase involved in cell wall biosynthesis
MTQAPPPLPSPLRLLTFSGLYPNALQPGHGPFVEARLRQLVATGAVESRVVAPVPWFPRTLGHPRLESCFGNYARLARVAPQEQRHGLLVEHPRYLIAPKVGMSWVPLTMALAARPVIQEMLASGYDFDVIDAHYFYPDGVAAMLLGRWFKRPVVITARGSDITLLPGYALPRRMIQWAARESAAMITVCQSLKNNLIALGAEANKITVLRNGVDLVAFQPQDQAEARAWLATEKLGQRSLGSGPVLVSVGLLIERKGHHLTIAALAEVPGVQLLIAGSGPERANLAALAQRLGVAERVHFLGQVAQLDLPRVYSAANAMVLASSREGWANVLLESMACGTPALATDVDGSGEVVAAPAAGRLIPERASAAIAAAIQTLLAAPPERSATRRYAEGFSWDATTQGQLDLFRKLVR